MLVEEVRSLIGESLKNVARERGITTLEAEERASSFLIVAAELLKYKHHLEQKLIKSNSLETVSYHKAIHEADGKNVTEKKVKAEANGDYILLREQTEEIQSDIAYLKAMVELFRDAHIMWRQIAKED